MKKGLLIILSGPSGVGKGTVRELLMKDPSLNLFYSVSMTTRNKRPHEVEGKDYYFVSKEEFLSNLERGNLQEHAEFVGNYYGTPKDKVERQLEEGKNVLLEIDVQGTLTILKKMKDCVSIFLLPPSLSSLEERIRGRSTETEEVIEKRLDKARKELDMAKFYKYQVCNDVVENAANKIASIIRNEMNK
ncbi:MAG TPA: guanylate kinase [Firmicutes bacterium]|nr:guanylate kinase [Bacillota bacterium]